MMSGGRNRFPFTASQWQELEHQALIFKCMASGVQIPPDLLFTIKRSCLDSSLLSSKLFPRQPPHMGWSCFQMGLGRKIDSEPGRCRRTDGKKWRCSKAAYPDSKYCERHMHRGKNRSRKPVEFAPAATITSPLSSAVSSSANTKIPSTSLLNHNTTSTTTTPPSHSLSLSPEYHGNYHQTNYSHQFSSSHDDNTNHLLLDSGGGFCSLTNSDYRNRNVYNGMKEEIDEHVFFSSETSPSSMKSLSDDAWQLTPLTINSSSSSSKKRSSSSGLHNEYSYLQIQGLSDHHEASKQQRNHQHNYNNLLRISCDYLKNERDQEAPKKTVHRFFDEWPPKTKDSWLDLDDKSANCSTTRLSMSIPSSHDFPIFNSRLHNDA